MTRILLVEDEDLLRAGVQEILEHNGYTVVEASNGEQALELMAASPVALVITDLVMPKMSGIDFIQRAMQQFPGLPVIVASGSPNAVMKRMGIDSIHVPGAAASIMKPFRAVDLLALVQSVLSETGR